MPRIPRADNPGSWHHVFNRAIARRTLFEQRADFRFFLAHLARAVRRGAIEVHAYCLMSTHYHLLVRSPEGRMADAMHRVQLAYSRWFNRSRRRDGGLVRGRYGSRPVRSLRYRRLLVRYIDDNPCSARIVDLPAEYSWGSARHYAKPAGPRWLAREWVESEVARELGLDAFRPAGYSKVFPARNGAELSEFIEARLAHGDDDDFLDAFDRVTDPAVRAWMVRKALLADGTRPGLPVLPLRRLEPVLRRASVASWVVRRGRTERDGAMVAYVGLGRDLCGATLTRLATDLGASTTQVHRIHALHRVELEEGTAYARRVLELARRTIEEWHLV